MIVQKVLNPKKIAMLSNTPIATTSAGRTTRTRQNQTLPTDRPPTTQELVDTGMTSSPKNSAQARNFLHNKGFLNADGDPTYEALAYALLSMAFSAPQKILEDGARAVALTMLEMTKNAIAEDTLSYVEKFLQPIAESISAITDDLEGAAERAEEILSKGSQNTSHSTAQANSISYATALKGTIPFSHETTLSKARTRNCQILIDKDPLATNDPLKELNEIELVTKANEALDLSKNSSTPLNSKFLGAKKLSNGGIVFDLNTANAASWVKENRNEFAKNLGAMSIIKDQAATVLVEYIPIAHLPDALAECWKIESESGIHNHALISTRWIKSPEQRMPGQHFAHVIAKFKDINSANYAIRDGLIIAGKCVWARKLNKEPRRCLKCQKINVKHFVAECNGMETCATCGGEHRVVQCTERNSGKVYCVNCKSNDHPSWNRLCPSFIALSKKMECQNPESSYRYFPTDEPWTWEQLYQDSPEEMFTQAPPPHELNTQHTKEEQYDRWADRSSNDQRRTEPYNRDPG